jgi:hypothetical protein
MSSILGIEGSSASTSEEHVPLGLAAIYTVTLYISSKLRRHIEQVKGTNPDMLSPPRPTAASSANRMPPSRSLRHKRPCTATPSSETNDRFNHQPIGLKPCEIKYPLDGVCR